MTLSDLAHLGAYCNAGFVDVFHDGKHTRIGSLSAIDADIDMTPDGVAFVNAVLLPKYIEVLSQGDSGVEESLPAPPPQFVATVTAGDSGLGALDALLASVPVQPEK